MATDSNRYGFFKNKSRAGITVDFVPYPTFPNMPNATFYYSFANNNTKTGNVSLVNANANTLVNLDTANIQPMAIPLPSGNVLFTDLTSTTVYNYDYVTQNITTLSYTISNNVFSPGSLDKINTYDTQCWDANGNIILFSSSNDHSLMGNTFVTIDTTNNVIAYDTSFRGSSNAELGPRCGIKNIVPIDTGNVLLLSEKVTGGSNFPQPYKIFNTETKQCSNAFINYGNVSANSAFTDNTVQAVLSPSNGNVYIIPGVANFANSFVDPANVDLTNGQKVIVEVDFNNDVVREITPGNSTIANNFNFGTAVSGDFYHPPYSDVCVGADGHVYMFPGKIYSNGFSRNNICTFDPTDVDGTIKLDVMDAWDSGNIQMHDSRYATLGIDGHITVVCTLQPTGESGSNAVISLVSIDTNPTTNTYQKGYNVSASGFDNLSKNFTWTGNGKLVGGPVAADSGSNYPIKVIQISGTGGRKLQYATWNRNSKNGFTNT